MSDQIKERTVATMTGFERYTKKTRRAMFLEEMEQVVPWTKLCALIEPYYPKPGNGGVRKNWSRCCGFIFCSSGSTWRIRRWKKRCTTRRRCASSRGSTWGGSRYRTRRRCASSVICWKSTTWEKKFWDGEAALASQGGADHDRHDRGRNPDSCAQ